MTPTPQEHATQEEISTAPVFDGERIVISGMSGLYPDSHSVSDLSDILYNKINPVSEKGLRYKFSHPEVVQHSGSVPGLNYFDAQFFKVHYRLANCMDPMARKILEQSYQAIYDAGINPDDLSGKKVGVYIGTCFSEAEKACFYEAASRSGFGIAGCSKTMFANRISYWLNAKGPSMSIDEACCSSTAALEQAYLAMSRGDCEAAIVGGAYLCLHPQSSVHYGRIMNLCQDGKTKSFDENANGCAKSEAINVLFLQKAKDALRIYANVLHAKSEFTCILPGETGPRYGFYRDVDMSVDFMKKFYEEARVPAEAIEYVEALGCAVKEADKVELQAIEKVFCNEREDPLLIGSVMSNIGYNEAASGITAITKVLLGYHTGKIAANLHCDNPRQDVVAIREGRMRVVTEHQSFKRTYVAVNGMSVTGVNSHVLLHGHCKPKDPSRYKSSIAHLVTISARHEQAVTYMLDNLKANPIDPEQLRLLHNIHSNNISGHLGRGFVILDTNEEQKTVCLSEKSEYFDNARRPLWFVYSGMGSQWAGMGTQLMRIPIFAAAIERCRKALEPKGIDIVDIITSTDEKTFDNILHSFVGIAAIQIGLTDILRELGLKPDGIIGHSVGELGCAYGDGCLTAEEMILSAYSRGLVSLETPFIRGSMAAIGLGYEQILPMCPPEIQVACHNGPESSTISGPAEIMREFVGQLTAKGIFAKEVPCSNIAYHSRYIAEAGPKLLEYLSEVIKDPKPRSERWISSSVPQDKWDEPSAKLCSAEYHTNNLLSPVLFEETSRLIPNDAVLVEIAPHGLLQAILKRSLHPNCKNIALTRRKHPDNTFLLLEGIGKLFMEGYNPKVNVLYPEVELPVSSGTPFLSHLVKWAHAEKWPMPLFRTASRKAAATCDYVTSLQDVESAYLQGHALRGHTVYPFSATLMLVWDIFAMTVGVPRKQISVEFRNLHLYSQPIMHDQRQLRLSMCLHRGAGMFEILNEDIKLVIGTIVALESEDVKKTQTVTEVDTKVNIDLTADDVYRLLRDRDYSYSGEFRSIEGVNASMTEASLIWRDNWVTFIDGLLQLNMLRQKHEGVSIPTHVRNMTINIQKHQEIAAKSFVSDYKVLMKAEVIENMNMTKCGGVTISHIKLENLPPMVNRDMTLKALKFVPNSQAALDGKWGGENYVSLEEKPTVSPNVTLQCSQIGDYDTLTWVEAPELTKSGIAVKVQYASINYDDVKKASGSLLYKENLKNAFGMDFSGTTKSGERVMGLVPCGAASSVVHARPELLWPVPAHWTLEDAATVPLAYAHALYCLGIKSRKVVTDNMSVLVHGGAGAFGQAVISIALAYGYEVFTTVSDTRKKHFLRKLFPALKAENIGNSRDNSFADMVMTATKGTGCNIVISSLAELKAPSINCVRSLGSFIDTSQLHNHDVFSYGMYSMTMDRSYSAVDISSIYNPANIEDAKFVQRMLSEGIARGYVRPLSRVTYAPHDAPSAFRLLAGSKHRGRVLLNIGEYTLQAQPRLTCSADRTHLILCNDDTFGLQIGDKLVERGAKKICVHYQKPSSYLQIKIKSWQESGVEVVVFTNDLKKEDDLSVLLNKAKALGPVEGVYVTVGDKQQVVDETFLSILDQASRTLCPEIKYFAVLSTGENSIGKEVCLRRAKDNLPATILSLPELTNDVTEGAWYRGATEAMERALRSSHNVVQATTAPAQQVSLLQKILAIAGITNAENLNKQTTFEELGIDKEKLTSICMYLRIHYHLVFEESELLALTINAIDKFEKAITKSELNDEKGLATFFSYVDSDELLATTDFVFLPTLVNDAAMRDDEFDSNQTYLCIIPGMESHYERFRVLCERLKLPALVLQPGLDLSNETVQQTAERLAEVFLKKMGLKNNFYLLGYESGIFIALEMAAILEKNGLTGTVYCLGFAPDEFVLRLEDQLAEYKTKEQLEDAVAKHMYSIMTGGDTTGVDEVLQAANTWPQKVDACVRNLLGRVSHSAQYARALIESALRRIEGTRHYVPRVHALRSQIVLMRAASSHEAPSPAALQRHSQRPVIVHQLDAPLAHATNDLNCAVIVNTYLDSTIHEIFEKKNLCNTYLINANSFMALD
ncbi:fatty acid synthase-like isoform X2 [Spodoptera frugiperda]|uniref:Fatty acid synthase-like isoform X2 n=1 Tax=Spodoptera frugiperda TaxID=7108 RepID=A0A9R0EP51_SPOFR|nr:fatty acid synthase-like isoform X2 [Spodoptera frugiperda]